MSTTIPNITVTVRCIVCGHEQSVNSAAALEDAQGKKHYYFGSGYHNCDLCEGPVETIEEET
jgi:hypothetical protein